MGFRVAWTEHGSYIRFSGPITDDDLVDAMHLVMADPQYDRLRYKILDLQPVTALGTFRKVEEIAHSLCGVSTPRTSGRRIAVAWVGLPPDLHPICDAYDRALKRRTALGCCRGFQRMRPAFEWVEQLSNHQVTLGSRIQWQDQGRYLAPRHRLIRCR